jgi:hypothetical protein
MAVPYGPPVDPRQVSVPADPSDAPEAWALCIAVGLILTLLAWPLRSRPSWAAGLAALGQTVMLTAPFAALLPKYVYGAYPTIDKQGSLLFYLEGVHRWMASHPTQLASYAPARLIGVHVGHLWVTEAFDLFLEPFAAMNAQGLLWLVLAWWCAWGFLRTLGAGDAEAFVLALPYGLGLHLFRDLDGYTIEKAAVFVVPLYGTCWLRALRDGGDWPVSAAVVVLLSALLNLYLALVIGIASVVASAIVLAGVMVKDRKGPRALIGSVSLKRLAVHYVATAILITPVAWAQASLLSGGKAIASPECFLWGRAALDTVTLWPPAWNRLEAWAALHPLALLLAIAGLWTRRRDPQVAVLAILGLVTGLLSLGPELVPGVPNPAYLAAWYGLPFFWRIAKPEVFFFVTWACVLGVAALGTTDRLWTRGMLLVVYLAFVAVWVGTVRLHPAYPGFSEYRPAKLAPGWEKRLERQPECSSLSVPEWWSR